VRIRTVKQLFRLAIAAFLLRAIVPVGFMPAKLSDGGPFVLCPGGPGGTVLSSLVERHASHAQHKHDGEGTTHEAWEHCPVGAALAAIAPPSEPNLELLQFRHVLASAFAPAQTLVDLPAAYLARAPPAV
jgi:hypothetical protein